MAAAGALTTFFAASRSLATDRLASPEAPLHPISRRHPIDPIEEIVRGDFEGRSELDQRVDPGTRRPCSKDRPQSGELR
jgi:hypothetical protein